MKKTSPQVRAYARHGFVFSRRNITTICKVFLDTIKPLNSEIYASISWLDDYIDWRGLGCPVWNAQWNLQDDLKGYMWQFTETMNIGGKLFDGNVLYS